MTTPKPKDASREITYQVGWKKGKIRMSPKLGQEPPADRVLELVWKQTPVWPAPIALALLIIVPAAAFGAIVWLVSLLANVQG